MTLFQYPFNTCFGNRERTSFDRTVLLGPLRCNQRQLAYTASESGGREKERAEGSRRGRRAQRERNGSAVGRTERMEHLSRRPRGGVQLTSRGPCAAQARTGEGDHRALVEEARRTHLSALSALQRRRNIERRRGVARAARENGGVRGLG